MIQEIVLAAATFVVGLLLLRTLLHKNAVVPATTSFVTLAFLFVVAGTYASLGLWVATGAAAFNGVVWFA